MSIRNILVPVRGDGKGEQVLNAALVLARKFDAHLDVVHARIRSDDLLTFGASLGGIRDAVKSIAETHATEEEARVKKLFQDYCRDHGVAIVTEPQSGGKGVTASWHEESGHQANVVARRGRLADIICVAQPEGQLGVNTFEMALMETGKPVISVPSKPVNVLGHTIAIAWNGSAEVAGAVTTARPVVETAQRVFILSAPEAEHDENLSAADLATYLRWHGRTSETVTLSCHPHEVGQTLLKACAEHGVDMLIMGGYAHVRRHDFRIGGVTQYVVEHAGIPVLFHH